jgi:hypothetical protein
MSVGKGGGNIEKRTRKGKAKGGNVKYQREIKDKWEWKVKGKMYS